MKFDFLAAWLSDITSSHVLLVDDTMINPLLVCTFAHETAATLMHCVGTHGTHKTLSLAL